METCSVFLRFIVGPLVLSAWASVAQAAPILGAFADVSAQWGNTTSSDSASGPSVASPSDATVIDPSYGQIDVAGSLARGSASVSPDATGKLLHSYSRVAEAGGTGTMDAASTERVVTQWIVASDGSVVSPGSSVSIDTLLNFQGSLRAANGAPYAEMLATMNVYQGGVKTTVFDGAGRMQSSSAGQSSNAVTSSGNFSGQFSGCPGTTSSRITCLDFNEYFSQLFSVIEGQLFEVELILATHAAGIIGTGESNATADFYNSGGFELSTGDVGGLRLTQSFEVETPVAAPEPGTLSLLATGLFGIAYLRRRRAANQPS